MRARHHRLGILAVLLLAHVAVAQDLAEYNRALAAYNAGDHVGAAQRFFALAEGSTDQATRQRSEYYLGQSFLKAGLPFAAASYYAAIVDAGAGHPFYLKAVEGLVEVQAKVNDQNLIPSKIDRSYDPEAWATLPAPVQARINLMIASIARRKGRLEEARLFLDAIDPKSRVYGQALYLTGVLLSDPRFPGRTDEASARAHDEEALKAFRKVLALDDPEQVGLDNLKALARLGVGRVTYGLGRFQEATEAYDSVERFSRYWDVALFENGFARFQNDDYGGALGSLQALYAPQFQNAFQPESRVLTATVYYFACLYDESKRALEDQERIYGPMRKAILPLLDGPEGERPPVFYYKLIADRDPRLPQPVWLWVRGNERLSDAFDNLEQIEREKAQLSSTQGWAQGGLVPTVRGYLEQNRDVLVQVAGTLARDRLTEAERNIKAFVDQANIIRFEISNAEKELAELGLDQQAMLASKRIYRPALPAPNWNYWRFQGEFWRDEIGYYQYTLKNGCPAETAGIE